MPSEIAVVLEHGKRRHGENYLEPFVSNDINVHNFTCAAQISTLNKFHSLSLNSLYLVTRIPFFALDTIYNHLFCSATFWQLSFEIRVFLFTQNWWKVILRIVELLFMYILCRKTTKAAQCNSHWYLWRV